MEEYCLLAGSESKSSPHSGCILVVDDADDCASSLAMLLQLEGHEAHVAHGGLEAIELAKRLRPAIIFMDLGMPDIDGFEATRRIRAQAWGQEIVICALTAYASSAFLERSKDAGFNHHLVKPTSFDELAPILSDTASERRRDR
jgi:CheY-like chemotaxis protein